MAKSNLQQVFSWTGFRGKTLWDWLQLLIVPAILGFCLSWFNLSENVRARRSVGEHARESMLQSYIGWLENLLLGEELRISGPKSEVRNIANKRTVAVLRQLDGERKRFLLRYLYELELIYEDDHVLTLGGAIGRHHLRLRADLNGARLNELNLTEIYLTRVDLIGADLRKSSLVKANLIGANLQGADLREADLSEAKLFGANLSGANLSGANLKRAEMAMANFRNAKVTPEQLADVKSLKGATMVDGLKHN